jgi:hypothetical protein
MPTTDLIGFLKTKWVALSAPASHADIHFLPRTRRF